MVIISNYNLKTRNVMISFYSFIKLLFGIFRKDQMQPSQAMHDISKCNLHNEVKTAKSGKKIREEGKCNR